jgi:hypothetical protein
MADKDKVAGEKKGGLKNMFTGIAGSTPQQAAAGFALGAAQTGIGMAQEKKAEALLPAVEDKMSRDYLELIRRKRRAAETGTSTTAERGNFRQVLKDVLDKSFKGGGGGSTSVLSQLLADQNAALRDRRAQEQLAYAQEEGKKVEEMAGIKRELGMFRANQKFAKAATNKAAGSTNMLASIGGKPATPKDEA